MKEEGQKGIEKKVQIVDELFDERQTRSFKLALHLGSEGLVAAVWDENVNRVLGLEYFEFHKTGQPASWLNRYETVLKESSFLHLSYKKVLVGIRDTKFTLVPNALYASDATETYFKFTHTLLDTEHLHQDNLPNLDARLLYTCPTIIENAIKQNHSPLSFHYASSAWIEYLLLTSRYVEGAKVAINMFPSHFEIAAILQGRLQLFNSFSIKNADDFIYYLMFCITQLGFNPEQLKLEIHGQISQESAMYQLAKRYIKNVEWASRPDALTCGSQFANIPTHCHTEIFSQFLYN